MSEEQKSKLELAKSAGVLISISILNKIKDGIDVVEEKVKRTKEDMEAKQKYSTKCNNIIINMTEEQKKQVEDIQQCKFNITITMLKDIRDGKNVLKKLQDDHEKEWNEKY